MFEELIREISNTEVFWNSLQIMKDNFSANSVILWIMMIFLVVGGVDKIRGNKLGYGEQFDEAFATMKPMALAMVGVLVMVPIFRMVLEPIIAPVYEFFGASPAMFAGTLLGVDAGAYPLAMEMAGGDVAAGSFSGVILGGTFGIILLGMIPISLELLREEDREVFSAAVLLAIITIPLGCIAGGLVMSLTCYPMAFGVMMANLIPVIIVAVLIALGLYFRPKQMMNAFCVLGKGMQILLIAALVVATFQAVTGLRLPLFYMMVEPTIPGGISPLNDALMIVGNIALILAGALPMILWISRTFRTPIRKLGERLGMNEAAATGLVATLASYFPAAQLVSQMNPKGKLLFLSFAIVASWGFGDHLGYVAGVDQNMVLPLVVAKMVAAISALILANALAPRFIKEEE